MKRLLTALAFGVVIAATAVAADAPSRVVAVGGIELERSLRPIHDRARSAFDPVIEASLTGMGYHVVPPAVTDSVWNHLRDSLGGFYDPFTGRVVREKFEAVYEGTRRALREDLGADAWMQPAIETVSPGFGGGEARWHGMKEETGGRGGLAGLLIGRTTGMLNAISLAIRIEDTLDGDLLYGRYGGIQLTSKLVSGELLAIDPDSLLRDETRIGAAVTFALDSLVARWPPR